MSFFGWGKGTRDSDREREHQQHPGRNLQDGLFQIASQACHILVQVNNTHNVSYGGSNTVTNVAYSKYTGAGESTHVASSSSSTSAKGPTSSTSRGYSSNHPGNSSQRKDQDVVVLLPTHRKSRTPRIRHKLSTVSENARLDVNSPTGGDDDLELWDQSGFMLRSDIDDPLTHTKWGAQNWCRPSCIPISIILILIVLVVLLPLLDHAAEKHASNSSFFGNESDYTCMENCRISLVESIPLGMRYPNKTIINNSTYLAWMDLIGSAEETIEIASLYWTMKRQDVYPDDSAKQGEDVFEALLEAGRDRNVAIKIAQNIPSQHSPNLDTEYLAKKAKAQVLSLNFAALLGGGVLHTKLWLVDRTHVYVGSANMDWRSLTQVKELGILAMNCSCLANDLGKIFDVYWQLGKDGKIPASWPDALATKINVDNPMNFSLDNNNYKSFVASSPPQLSPKGRTNDLDAIIHCMEKAEKFIYISVMDYFPLTIYTAKVKYWPDIDNALRSASIDRKITVRLLISWWKHSRPSEDFFLKSLMDITNSYKNVRIEVNHKNVNSNAGNRKNRAENIKAQDCRLKLLQFSEQKRFIVPTNPDLDKIPFSRVNHNKYMVTDAATYVGTSNWSGDYFINTAGIGMVFEDVGHKNVDSIRKQLEDIFNRDWNSAYAHSLDASRPNRETTPRPIPRREFMLPSSPHRVPV